MSELYAPAESEGYETCADTVVGEIEGKAVMRRQWRMKQASFEESAAALPVAEKQGGFKEEPRLAGAKRPGTGRFDGEQKRRDLRPK